MVASGDLVFVGMQFNQSYQVAILDAIDPAHPVEIAAIEWEGYASDFHLLGVIGEMLYISVKEEGIRIYDISTPSAPALVKTFNDDWEIGYRIADGGLRKPGLPGRRQAGHPGCV